MSQSGEDNETSGEMAHSVNITFPASRLSDFCNPKQSESAKLRFLRKFKPFSDIKIETEAKRPVGGSKSLLNKNDKEFIKKQLDESINTESLTFDDDSIIEAFETKLKLSENEEEYHTAESDQDNLIDSEDEENKKILQVIRYVSSMRGRKLEDHVLEKINKEKNTKFEKNKTRKFMQFETFSIVGIIDGVCKESKTILEIKTRKELEKASVSVKEKRQALTYMKMHECTSCLFVELGPNGNFQHTVIEWDEEEFNNNVIKRLEEFVKYARSLSVQDFKVLMEKHKIK